MDVDTFIRDVAVVLKQHGFKKAGAIWRRVQPHSIAVFNVQKSPWGDGTYFVNVGTYFSALGQESKPTSFRCHVQRRLDVAEPAVVVATALDWFQQRSLLRDARAHAESDSKKGMVFKELRNDSPA